jgi:predicted nucleic acid-binding protein
VEEDLILETTFLVDLERELLRGEEGPAQDFLAGNASARLYITFTIAGELAAGVERGGRDRWEEFLRSFVVLPFGPDVCWEYGQTYRYLKANGLLIGANDLWIGATALAFDQPLVTRNVDHFRRIPGLTVVEYGVHG